MMLFAGLLGRLSWDAFPHVFITQVAAIGLVLGGIAAIALMTYFKKWGWLWREWLTTTNHKRIGIMYVIVAMLMLLRGLSDALMIRAQQATSVGASNGPFPPDMFQQVFSAHGTIMIFFVAMGLMFGIINLIMPQQLGSRDVAYPWLNALSFWLFTAGMLLTNLSLVVGEFSGAGWLAYPPLSEAKFSPGVGVDYWIWSLQIAGVGSLMSGINFMATILKNRAKGMTMMKMPMFPWTVFGSMTLVAFAFPILTVTLTLLFFDRAFGMHFFTADGGGNAMMYVNLIWAWGHPEVYILVLPAFGVFSEVVATFSRKRLFGYTSMVWAIWAIVFLSFTVWLHHFFTMGAGADVNGVFGIATMLIAIPTGVKIFNWLFTMYQGKIKFTAPMVWFMGFVFLFTMGGVTGVLMAVPPVDFQVHNSLFLVAHFHTMIIAGVVFGFMAGLNYWFPKVFGFRLHDGLGKLAAWCWIIGFILAFGPLYILGFMGATRRLDHYDASLGWQPLFIVAAVGVVIICIGVAVQLLQLAVSILQRGVNRDHTGDPWNGRTLEWATASPTQEYNFAVLPEVTERDQFWLDKQQGKDLPDAEAVYHDIRVPKNSPHPIIIAGFAFVAGFGFIWHIWWLAIVAMLGLIITVFAHGLSDDDGERVIPAAEVARIEAAWKKEKEVVRI
jgi:cytochrome o ubiquinol oxidase subunit 1